MSARNGKELVAGRNRCLLSVIIAIAFVINAGVVLAEQTNQDIEINALRTEMIDGFCLGVIGTKSFSTNGTTVDDSLCFFPWTTNAATLITIPAGLEYVCQAELFDTNGVAISKTKLGKTIGVKFNEFDWAGSRNGIATRHLWARKIGEMAAAPFLFDPYRPSDLFKIDQPGNYTLEVRFQIMVFMRPGPGRTESTNKVIRFPPLAYPLVKPDATPQRTP